MASAPATHYCVAVRDRERNSLSEKYTWGQSALPGFYYSLNRMKNSTLKTSMFPVFKKMVLAFETAINSANICGPLLKGSLSVRVQTLEEVTHLKLFGISGSFRVWSQLWAASLEQPLTVPHCPGRHLEHSSGVPHSLH